MCPVCRKGMSSHQPSAGPSILFKFQSDLGHILQWTLSLVFPLRRKHPKVVDGFSEVVQFIPLSKLWSAVETGDLLVSHVFRLHGFLRDIMSGAPVYVLSLESLLQCPRCLGESVRAAQLQESMGSALPSYVLPYSRRGRQTVTVFQSRPIYCARGSGFPLKDLTLPVDSRKLAPHFVGPFVIECIINPSSVDLKLPPSLKIHLALHVSQIKLVSKLDLVPLSEPPTPPCVIDGGPSLLGLTWSSIACRSWWSGRGTATRKGLGFSVPHPE